MDSGQAPQTRCVTFEVPVTMSATITLVGSDDLWACYLYQNAALADGHSQTLLGMTRKLMTREDALALGHKYADRFNLPVSEVTEQAREWITDS